MKACPAEEVLASVKMCNCAQCGDELVSLSSPIHELTHRIRRGKQALKTKKSVAGRVKGRPYCANCLWESR